ncbi:MAG: YcxB family protein [Verrucomicrobiales bacterium]|nr:YcxB family protein [Verrucomicrobiales bacterium]
MRIKTTITQDDYAAFVKHVARFVSPPAGNKTIQRLIGVGVGLAIAFVASVVDLSAHAKTLALFFSGVIAGIVLLLAVISGISRRQMLRMRPAEDGFILGSQETILEDEALRQKSEHHQALFQWSLLRQIHVAEQHVFIMFDRVAGIILPRRDFSSDEERERFVNEIEQRSGKRRT